MLDCIWSVKSFVLIVIYICKLYSHIFVTCVLSSANLSRVVPHGLLVFFPSFPLMEKTLEFWKVSGKSAESPEERNNSLGAAFLAFLVTFMLMGGFFPMNYILYFLAN